MLINPSVCATTKPHAASSTAQISPAQKLKVNMITVKRGDDTSAVVESAKKELTKSGMVQLSHVPGAMQKLVAVVEQVKQKTQGLHQYNRVQSGHALAPETTTAATAASRTRPTLTVVLASQLKQDFSAQVWTHQHANK